MGANPQIRPVMERDMGVTLCDMGVTLCDMGVKPCYKPSVAYRLSKSVLLV